MYLAVFFMCLFAAVGFINSPVYASDSVFRVNTKTTDFTGGAATITLPQDVKVGTDSNGKVDVPYIYLGFFNGGNENFEAGFAYVDGNWKPSLLCQWGPRFSDKELKKYGLNSQPNVAYRNGKAYAKSTADIKIKINGTMDAKQTIIKNGKLTTITVTLPKAEYWLNGELQWSYPMIGIASSAGIKRVTTVVGYTNKSSYSGMQWRKCSLAKDKSASKWNLWDATYGAKIVDSDLNGLKPVWVNKYYNVDVNLRK
jgi:hypothetical protein